MRGSVNLVVRKGGKVRASLSHANVITQLFNPALYDGSNKDLLEFLTAHSVDPQANGAETIAPVDLGIVVFDHDRRSVLEMQLWCPTQTSSLVRQIRPWEHVAAAGQRGWLGSALHDAVTDQMLAVFPDDAFASTEGLVEWASAMQAAIARTASGRPPLASFKLQPPGWTFREYAPAEAEALQQYLVSAGFDTVAGAPLWNEWLQSRT
jgi:hypothetical protein